MRSGSAPAPVPSTATTPHLPNRAERRGLAALGLTVVLGFLAGLGALYAFADLAEDVMAGETMHVDRAVLAWLRRFQSPGLDVVARACSFMGAEGLALVLAAALMACALRRAWAPAAGLALVTVGAQLLNDVLKTLFHRTRPAPVEAFIPAQAFSFPSGHAMVSAAFYCYLAYIGARTLGGATRTTWFTAAAVLVLLIGVSRLYLGVHYLTDVIAGYAAGFLWTDAVILGGRFFGRARRRAELAA